MRPPGSRHSTVPKQKPAKEQRTGTPLPPRGPRPLPAPRVPTPRPQPRREIGRIFEETETSLVDVIDNLLNRGVVLNADVFDPKAVPDESIRRVHSELTILGGRVVHGDPKALR